MPDPPACFAVAAALGCAAIVTARSDLRLLRAGIGFALVGRGVIGLTGRTSWLVPWTPGPEFVDLDRRIYGPWLPESGRSSSADSAPAEQGYPAVSLTAGSTLRAMAGSAIYLTLIALLGLGVATLVRSSAAAIGLVLGLLFVFPLLAAVVTDPDWQRHLRQLAPTAGLSVQASVDLDSLPIGPWPGVGVTALWAAGALAAGAVALRGRDA